MCSNPLSSTDPSGYFLQKPMKAVGIGVSRAERHVLPPAHAPRAHNVLGRSGRVAD